MIIYDHREDRSEVPKALRDFGVELKRETLEVGDYVITGKNVNLVIERKTAQDYIKSMRGEHLNNQLYEMSTNFSYTILIIEGYMTGAAFELNAPRQQILASIATGILKPSADGVRGAISTLMLDTPYDTAQILKYFHDNITGDKPLVRYPRIKAEKWKLEDRAVAVLSGFPNIKEKRARKILEHPRLNTLTKILTSDIATLMEVEGIGKKIAKTILDLADKEYQGGT